MTENEKKDEPNGKKESFKEKMERRRKEQLAEKGLPDYSFKELTNMAQKNYFRLFQQHIESGIIGFVILALIIVILVLPRLVIKTISSFLTTIGRLPATVNSTLNQPIGANYLLIVLILVTGIGYFTSFLSVGLEDPGPQFTHGLTKLFQ